MQTANLDADLTGYPLYIRLDNLAEARADGFDLRFTSSDGTSLLPYERESWASGSGDCWVKTDVARAGTYLFCYYGNPGVSDGATPATVWDDNFLAVWHMSGSGTTLTDSKGLRNATKLAATEPTETTGKVVKAQDFDGSNDSASYSSAFGTLSQITASAWVNTDTLTKPMGHRLWIVLGTSGGSYMSLVNNTPPVFASLLIGGAQRTVGGYGPTPFSIGQWYLVTCTYDGHYVRGYCNGILYATSPTDLGGATVNASGAGYIGRYLASNPGYEWDGKIDEVRVSNVARSSAWIKFDFYNQNESDHEETISSQWLEGSTGGASLGGSADVQDFALFGQTMTGGVRANGAAVESVKLRVTYNETASGGLRASGSMRWSMPKTNSCCFCGRVFWEIGSGGLLLGGDATILADVREGGSTLGGSALVEIANDAYDSLVAYWTLGESTGPYLDLTRHHLDGTARNAPTYEEGGLFCFPYQHFDGSQSIALPPDPISAAQAFSVSLWVRLGERYNPRILFSRGCRSGSSQWVFALGYSYFNNLWATIQTTDGVIVATHDIYSDTQMEEEKWYHVAASFAPSDGLRIYIDGEPAGSEPVEEPRTVEQTNGGFIGNWNLGAQPTADLQDVRLYSVAHDDDWWATERKNYCSSEFFADGGGVWECVTY